MSGKQVRLFLVDGTPGGLRTAEITNWTGHVLMGPRADVGALLQREEAKRTGVYLLLGEDQEAIGETRCYIGEADVVADRLKEHLSKKEFWDRAVIITSKDANLTKSHGRYLEARLIALANQARRATLENATAPSPPRLPEADASDMDEFLVQLQIILPVLGVNVIRVRAEKTLAATPDTGESPVFLLQDSRAGTNARAQLVDGEFTVLEGSVGVGEWSRTGGSASTRKSYASYRAHHERLVSEGVIAIDGLTGVFTRDHVFSSPSTAAAILLGRSSNGRREWVSGDGQLFGSWEEREVP